MPGWWKLKDIVSGIPGYVTCLPQDITGKRNWQVDDYKGPMININSGNLK